MSKSSSQQGFSVVFLVAFVGVLGILGLVGYNVYQNQQDKKANLSSNTAAASNTNTKSTSSEEVTSDIKPAPEIASTDDLKEAERMLDEVDVESVADDSELNVDLAGF